MTGYKRGYMFAPEPEEDEPDVEGGWVFAIVLFVVGMLIIGGCLAFGIGAMIGDNPEPEQQPGIEEPMKNGDIGDDNQDGHIDEDESGWNCETMGNMVCGPEEHLP